MPIIDVHAHWVPESYKRAVRETGEWYGITADVGEVDRPESGFNLNVDQRLDDMDSLGVDMQMLSPQAGFYQYGRQSAETVIIARECNDEILGLVEKYPTRFCGVGTLPLQDISASIDELKRVVSLGLKGVVMSDHVAGSTYEEAKYLPFWECVEELGAVVFFHQGFDQRCKIGKYHFDNSVGNLVEHTLNFGVLAAGGVLDRFPNLKLIFGHAGGYIPYAVARMDKVALGFPMDHADRSSYRAGFLSVPSYSSPALKLPSEYLRSFYYDCCTYSAANLRFLIDSVGIDRILFGTDTPAPMLLTDGVRWIEGLVELTSEEKRAILIDNPSRLLNL